MKKRILTTTMALAMAFTTAMSGMGTLTAHAYTDDGAYHGDDMENGGSSASDGSDDIGGGSSSSDSGSSSSGGGSSDSSSDYSGGGSGEHFVEAGAAQGQRGGQRKCATGLLRACIEASS